MTSRLRSGARPGAAAPHARRRGDPLVVLLASPWRTSVPPSSLGWLERGDAAQHQLGWQFFAREPAGLSPRVAAWPHPMGTTMGFTDSIPIVAVPLRLLAGARGAELQYFGVWIAGCVAALAALGALALRRLELPGWASALGGALLGLDPVVYERIARGHFSLCAQALILATFLAWMRSRAGGPPRTLWPFGAVAVVAAGVHPYLALLVVALWAGAVAFETRRTGLAAWRRHAPVAAIALPAGGAVFLLSGFAAGGATLAAGGFGGYCSDVAALLNPGDRSALLPALFGGPTLAEGFAYLGAGTLAMGVVLLARTVSERVGRRVPAPPPAPAAAVALREILWIAAALAAFAAFPVVSLLGFELADLRSLMPWRLEELLGTFRANGRFVWPLRLAVALALLRGTRAFAGRPRSPRRPPRRRAGAAGGGSRAPRSESLRSAARRGGRRRTARARGGRAAPRAGAGIRRRRRRCRVREAPSTRRLGAPRARRRSRGLDVQQRPVRPGRPWCRKGRVRAARRRDRPWRAPAGHRLPRRN